ncbi:MAG: Spy/CpxP family protein refolding chaperone [Candidatus Omnitrophica bacterium]|nr:Spy/CpxP family protein refolding chaperone [Candidatus Omnitrophota bacterium]
MKNGTWMKMVAIVGICGMALSGPVAYAGWGEGTGDRSPKFKKHGDFFKDLDLTPEQKAKVEAQREAQEGLSKPLREQIRTKMQGLHGELSKPASDKAVVNGLVGDINNLKGQLFAQRIDGVLELKQVLTPEQFGKVQAKFGEPYRERGARKNGRGMKP